MKFLQKDMPKATAWFHRTARTCGSQDPFPKGPLGCLEAVLLPQHVHFFPNPKKEGELTIRPYPRPKKGKTEKPKRPAFHGLENPPKEELLTVQGAIPDEGAEVIPEAQQLLHRHGPGWPSLAGPRLRILLLAPIGSGAATRAAEKREAGRSQLVGGLRLLLFNLFVALGWFVCSLPVSFCFVGASVFSWLLCFLLFLLLLLLVCLCFLCCLLDLCCVVCTGAFPARW